jgi:type VI secretion system protein ImpJ
MKARDIPEAIQWHEGMLLTPEHFQQMNTRQEMLAGYGLSCAPYQWGVRRFEWDANHLAAGLLSVTELEAILPDGLVINLATQSGLQMELKPCLEQMKLGPVPVCLVVPVRKPVTVEGDLDRYESIPGVPDQGQDEDGASTGIPRLRPRLNLLPGSIPPKYVGFPLMRIRYENEVFTASPDYPVLSVPVSSRIGSLCSLIARHVREKALYLADRVRSGENGSVLASGGDPERLIHSLVSALPGFEAALYAGQTHPFQLYLALCALAGSVAGVGLSMVPRVFAPYDHNNPYQCFEEIKTYIFQVISEGISETWVTFRFRKELDAFVLAADAGWSELLPAQPRPGRTSMALALRGPSGSTEKEMLAWGNNCVIGSASVVSSLVTRRILGSSRRHVEANEDLVVSKGQLLFEIHNHAEFIQPGEDLHVFDRRPDAVTPTDIFLFVRKPGTY